MSLPPKLHKTSEDDRWRDDYFSTADADIPGATAGKKGRAFLTFRDDDDPSLYTAGNASDLYRRQDPAFASDTTFPETPESDIYIPNDEDGQEQMDLPNHSMHPLPMLVRSIIANAESPLVEFTV